jgi:DNA-binding helix-hairpin-helix protein with protein kinase domain
MIKVFDPQGLVQELGERFAKGGEGSIYPLQRRPDVLVKVYHPEIIIKRGKALQEKVEAMCQLGKENDNALRNDRRLSWPLLSVFDEKKQWIGYAMYRAKGQPMFKLAHTMLYKKNFPGLDRHKVVAYLLNLLDVASFLHSRGVMIGDCNLQNILCDPQSDAVTLIDCDSYQVVMGNKFFPCPVGMPDMTAKEQQGIDFSKVKRTEESEAFSIAMIMFMALMLGRHPYDIVGGSERAENLRKGDFPYGKGNKGIPRGRWYNIWSHMPHKIKSLFICTFMEGANEPAKRATLYQWLEVLKIYRNEIAKGWHEVAMEPAEAKKSEYRGNNDEIAS